MLVINDKYFQGLSPDVRKAIMDSAKDASMWLMDVTIKSENEYYDKLKKEGVKITTPDLGPIRAAVQPIHKEYGEKLKATALMEEIVKTK